MAGVSQNLERPHEHADDARRALGLGRAPRQFAAARGLRNASVGVVDVAVVVVGVGVLRRRAETVLALEADEIDGRRVVVDR